MKLKEKIKNWLFKEELNDIQETKEKYNDLFWSVDRADRNLKEAQEMYDKAYNLLTDCHKFMNSICDVGTDIGFKDNEHSWAVICVHGNMDYVKFVDMNQKDIRAIVDFLKSFKYSNRVTDSPLHRGYIEDMIMKW